MKIICKINSLLGGDLKASIHPNAKLKGMQSVVESEHTSNSAIDPEDVIAWLVAQPNANGTLYLENVVRQYMGALRAAPGANIADLARLTEIIAGPEAAMRLFEG